MYHELSEKTTRKVTPSRTSFHINFGVASLPNWDENKHGEWHYFKYDFDYQNGLFTD